MKHLPAVMKVLEFLNWKSRKVEDYRPHLDRMIQLCGRPPLLERTSESLFSSVLMEHYFTFLGYLLTMSQNEEEFRRTHDVLSRLLIERTKSTNIAAIKLDLCRRAMESSRLPIVAAELLEAASPNVYPRVLELAYMLASVSHQCCKKNSNSIKNRRT